ncbi:MAG TPA: hypothetical protein VGO26_05605, partial [Amnibacterium sp.]|nr:hypothetical protein [Amnibacterium sp.]
GFPKDNAATLGTGWVQHFTKGTTYFQSGTGGFGVPGAIDAGYTARKGPTGELGWPTRSAVARTAAGITGTVQAFQQGDVYSSKAGTAAVLGPVRGAFTTSADAFDVLGWPTADANAVAAAGGGTAQVFTGGRLYVPTGKPAIAVTGVILPLYVARGEAGGSLGWPVSTQATVSAHGVSKVVQSFTNGAAYATGSSVTTVTGSLSATYAADGGPTGRLGWVTGPARHSTAAGGGWSQAFDGGTLYYSSTSTKTYALTGVVLKTYVARGEAGGSLGWPVGDAAGLTTHGSTRTVQTFQNGAAYVSGSTLTTVTGGTYTAYSAAGGPTGPLGWVAGPSRRTAAAGGGWIQSFGGGAVYYSSTTRKAFPATGSILALYVARGGPGSSLGWPTSTAAVVTADSGTRTVQSFGGGAVYQNGSVVQTVTGSLFTKYSALGGPSGALGWETGPARSTTSAGGGWTQTFAHGELFYSSSSRQAHPVSGGILTAYLKRGGPAGALGWPTGDPTVNGAVTTQVFQHGTVTSQNGTITVK